MAKIPATLGNPVVTRIISWSALVIQDWGDEWAQRDIVYRFSDGTTKQSTDPTNRGFYAGGINVRGP